MQQPAHIKLLPIVLLSVATWATITTRLHAEPLSVPAAATTQASNTVVAQGVTFTTPVPFSEPIPMGTDAVGILYPATATPGGQQFLIRLIKFTPDSLQASYLSDTELASYVRFRFLGSSGQAQGVRERLLLNNYLQGDVQLKRQSNKVAYVELYTVQLANGQRLAIAFEADTRMPGEQVEQIISTVAQSMQEVPLDRKPKSKRDRPRRTPF